MQFINIVVHSVEDMNFRVHLQFDFTKLCLDDYLDVSWDITMQHTWTDRLFILGSVQSSLSLHHPRDRKPVKNVRLPTVLKAQVCELKVLEYLDMGHWKCLNVYILCRNWNCSSFDIVFTCHYWIGYIMLSACEKCNGQVCSWVTEVEWCRLMQSSSLKLDSCHC